jgi:hypothetical protein
MSYIVILMSFTAIFPSIGYAQNRAWNNLQNVSGKMSNQVLIPPHSSNSVKSIQIKLIVTWFIPVDGVGPAHERPPQLTVCQA